MDAYVLRSRSPPCIGTVSFPGFVGCTICRCEPFCAFFSQPSAFRICRISFAVTLSPPVFIITRIMRIVNICCKYKCKLSMYIAALLILAGFFICDRDCAMGCIFRTDHILVQSAHPLSQCIRCGFRRKFFLHWSSWGSGIFHCWY